MLYQVIGLDEANGESDVRDIFDQCNTAREKLLKSQRGIIAR